MKYLFGDATSFPLTENFLDTLCSATEACAALLRADELADEGNRAVQEAEARVNRELAALSAVARKVEESFGADPPVLSPDAGPVQLASARIAEQAWATIKQTRAQILQIREAAVLSAAQAAPHAQVLPALSAFLTSHQLPDTIWSIRWRGGVAPAPSKAEVLSCTPCGLEATFDIDIPQGHLWARPARVLQLEKDVVIKLMRKPWLRAPRPCPERLDKLFVAAVTHTPERAAVTLVRSARDRSEGIEIVLRCESQADVTATRLGKDGQPIGFSERLDASDVVTVNRLWARIEATIGELVIHRRRATAATMGGVPVREIVHPEGIAEVIIEAIAPLVREVARRSGSPRELSLKRALGDGRREEIFIPYDAVLALTGGLSERHQAMFDAFGLREKTGARALIPKPPPRAEKTSPQVRLISA